MNLYLKYFFSVLYFILLATTKLNAQLIIDGTLTPTQLVQNVLMGSGVSVTNITYTGAYGPDTSAIGKFSGVTNLGLSSGIVLTTGTIYGVNGPAGPNNSIGAGLNNLQPGDLLLNNIIDSTNTFNAAVLEFDFIPKAERVQFRYVFGSEEYPDYVCSESNDLFGIFLSGSNPNGGFYSNKNLAIIPGTTLPVAINTINSGNPGAGAVTGICTSENLANANYFIDNSNGITIQYEGFTTVLVAEAPVICGSSYHIKIAIADVDDGIWDSGVFLEAGSLSTWNSCEVIAPNVFTPNGDGKNEKYIIKNLEYYQGSKLIVFNRLGTVVYENTNYQNDWEGDNVVDGTYYYILYVSDNSLPQTGFLTILR